MRKPVMAANWKMHKTVKESIDFVKNLKDSVLNTQDVEVVICAPFTLLGSLKEILSNTHIGLGAQNMYWEEKGAFTGEISPLMLVDIGCKYVIIGHSERRQYFGENDVNVNLKFKTALKHNLIPIVCVGEKLAERELGQTDTVVSSQINFAFSDIKVTSENVGKIIVAYEPVWAIGTGKVCDPVEANRVIGLIRKNLSEKYSDEIANKIRILYGGSVSPDNVSDQMKQPNIDGGLVGGASLKPDSFSILVEKAKQNL